jgi:hypothetical protein
MAYTPNDIYDYIIENDRESEFLQAITLHKQNFSIGEITDRRFLVKEDKTVKFISKMYKINIQITDDDIITAVMNGLYVSAFISRQGDAYNVHFLVHAYPENMKSQFDSSPEVTTSTSCPTTQEDCLHSTRLDSTSCLTRTEEWSPMNTT